MVEHEQDPLVLNEEEVHNQEALARLAAVEQQLRVMKDILVLGELLYLPSTPPTNRWLLYTKGGSHFAVDDAGTHHNLLSQGGVTDHGVLTGLNDNDHAAIYYTEAEVDALLHAELTDHGALGGLGDGDHNAIYYTEAEVNALLHNASHTLASHSAKAHADLSDAPADAHHTAGHTLASHSTRPHSALTDAPASAHHTKYIDSDAVTAVEAEDPLDLAGVINLAKNLNLAKSTETIDANDEITVPVTSWVYLTPASGSSDSLDGIGAGVEGQVVYLTRAAGKAITLVHNGTVTAGKKLMLSGTINSVLAVDWHFAIAIYDAIATVWNVFIPFSVQQPTPSGQLSGTWGSTTVDDGADATAIHDDTADEISALTEKGTPVDADHLIIEDSAASNVKKRITIGNLPGGGGVTDHGALTGLDDNDHGAIYYTEAEVDALLHTKYTDAEAILAIQRVIGFILGDPNGDVITTGNNKAPFRVPAAMNGWELLTVEGFVSTVSSSGAITVMVHKSTRSSNIARNADVDMLSTPLTIDQGEFDTIDAVAAVPQTDGKEDVVTGDHIYIDIDAAGADVKGLYVGLTFRKKP